MPALDVCLDCYHYKIEKNRKGNKTVRIQEKNVHSCLVIGKTNKPNDVKIVQNSFIWDKEQ